MGPDSDTIEDESAGAGRERPTEPAKKKKRYFQPTTANTGPVVAVRGERCAVAPSIPGLCSSRNSSNTTSNTQSN